MLKTLAGTPIGEIKLLPVITRKNPSSGWKRLIGRAEKHIFVKYPCEYT